MSSPAKSSPQPALGRLLVGGAAVALVGGLVAYALTKRTQKRSIELANLPQQTRYAQVRLNDATHSYADYQAAVKKVAQQMPIDKPFFVVGRTS